MQRDEMNPYESPQAIQFRFTRQRRRTWFHRLLTLRWLHYLGVTPVVMFLLLTFAIWVPQLPARPLASVTSLAFALVLATGILSLFVDRWRRT